MIIQKEFTLTPHRRGFHLITEEIVRNLPQLPPTGLLHLFIKRRSGCTDRYGSYLQQPCQGA